MYYARMNSPVGQIVLSGSDKDCVEAISFAEGRDMLRIPENANLDTDYFVMARRQLSEYFSRERTAFDFPMKLVSTGFRREVLERLQSVPYGSTLSYKELGEAIGRPRAARAVGGAVGSNPLSIVIPCHRVLATGGGLGGFGGGLYAKRTLLKLEGVAGH